jgi:SAM-dependent methyltransferase
MPVLPVDHTPEPRARATVTEHNTQQVRYFEARTKQTMLPGFTPFIQRQADALLAFSGLQPGARVLEVGCGMGRHTFYLAEHGLKMEGLDLTPGLLDGLRAFDAGRYNIPTYCGDVADFAESLAGQFDAVIGFFVLHHILDLDSAFAAIGRIVKPGGIVAFQEPNPNNPLYYLQITFTPGMSWATERGIFRMRPALIGARMAQSGLHGFRVRRFGFLPRMITNRAWGGPLEDALGRVPLIGPVRPFQMFGAVR